MTIRSGFVLLVVLAATATSAAPAKDPRLVPISRQELERLIPQTPMDSPAQMRLLSRGLSSGLVRVAYEQYTRLWEKSPDAFYPNLLRGSAAFLHRNYAGNPYINELKPKKGDELLAVAEACLEKTVKLAPKSAVANMIYGRFLVVYGFKRSEGLKLIKKAVTLAPKDPGAHRALGSVYSTPQTSTYDPKKAEVGFRTAIRLDPSYASPHLDLVLLYSGLKRLPEARRQMQTYLDLLPAGARGDPSVPALQAMIGYKPLAGSGSMPKKK